MQGFPRRKDAIEFSKRNILKFGVIRMSMSASLLKYLQDGGTSGYSGSRC